MYLFFLRIWEFCLGNFFEFFEIFLGMFVKGEKKLNIFNF